MLPGGKIAKESLKRCPIVYFVDFVEREKLKSIWKYKTIGSLFEEFICD